MARIKVAVADDQRMFVEGLAALIGQYTEFKLLHTAFNGKELIDNLEKRVPDVILLDLEMPEMDGIQVMKYMQKNYPDVRVIILTMYDTESLIVHLMELGARGYILKDSDPSCLADAIYSVHDTGYYFNDTASRAMIGKIVQSDQFKPTFHKTELTEREIEVIKFICDELTSDEIAEKMYINVRTVHGHRERIKQKTGARNVVGIVLYAIKNGLVDLSCYFTK